MTIYVQNVDITPASEVIVSGQLSATNISAVLHPRVYIMPPADGVWDFDLSETIRGCFGATMMVPFRIAAGFAEANEANGVRIHLPGSGPGASSILQLKVRRVDTFTTKVENHLWIQGAHYEAANQQLVVDIKYGGGCFEHAFALEWDGTVRESAPVQYPFNLVDLSERDPCKAIVPRQLRFDLSTPELELQIPSNFHLMTPPSLRGYHVTGPLYHGTSVQ